MPLTEEQQHLRNSGIGASEIAALCGLSPYASPIDIYMRKMGLAESVPSHHIERGNYLEPAILSWHAARQGCTLEYPGTLRHPQHPRVLATPDAIAVMPDGTRRVVEVKAPGRHTMADWGPPESDEVPEYYRVQCIWQMAVTGLKEADLVAFMDGDIQRYTVRYHQRLFDALRQAADAFWQRHILPQVAPEPDGTEGYSRFHRAQFPDVTRDIKQDCDEATCVLAHDYANLSYDIRLKEKQRQKIRQQIEARIGDAEGIEGPYGKITWKAPKPRVVTDWQAIAEEMEIPEAVIARYTRTEERTRRFDARIKGAP